VQASRKGVQAILWGQVRPGSGPQRYILQRRLNGVWQNVGGSRITSSRGFLSRAVSAPRGSIFRIWLPGEELASPTLVAG
jgi:hypothetical protein